MNISKLFKIDDDVVFYSAELNKTRLEAFEGLRDGSKVGYSFLDGSAMEAEEAVRDLVLMADVAPPTNNTEAVLRNMYVSDILVSMVRGEILSFNLADLGLTGVGLLTKLSPVISALRVGMFREARALLAEVEVDAFLTLERIAKYDAMLESSDSIDYTQ